MLVLGGAVPVHLRTMQPLAGTWDRFNDSGFAPPCTFSWPLDLPPPTYVPLRVRYFPPFFVSADGNNISPDSQPVLVVPRPPHPFPPYLGEGLKAGPPPRLSFVQCFPATAHNLFFHSASGIRVPTDFRLFCFYLLPDF